MGIEAMSPAPSREAVKKLADERDAVERELASTIDALMAPGGGGLSGPLVDAEGYPRTDIDVALVRTRRHRVATLRNDVDALSATLHQRLQEVLAAPPAAVAPAAPPAGDSSGAAPPSPVAAVPAAGTADVAPPPPPVAVATAAPSRGVPLPVPFARVDAVHADSPAAAAGLRAGDLLASLGPVSMEANSAASAVAALPAALAAAVAAGATLPVVVLRRAPDAGGADGAGIPAEAAEAAGAAGAADAGGLVRVELVLRPATWGGRGVLGCHVVPVRVDETGFQPRVATAAARHGRGE